MGKTVELAKGHIHTSTHRGLKPSTEIRRIGGSPIAGALQQVGGASPGRNRPTDIISGTLASMTGSDAFVRTRKPRRPRQTSEGSQPAPVRFSALFTNRAAIYGRLGLRALEHVSSSIDHYTFSDGAAGWQEVVRISDELCILLTSFNRVTPHAFTQIGEDLIIMQFRLQGSMIDRGSGTERSFDRPMCQISYLPEGLSREVVLPGGAWRSLALVARPQALDRWGLVSSLPPLLREQINSRDIGMYLAAVDMSPDVLNCMSKIFHSEYEGDLRRAMIESLCVQMACASLHQLGRLPTHQAEATRLSKADLRKVAEAHSYMEAQLGRAHTLANVARHVGLNRTKFAVAFKAVYGRTFFERLRSLRMETAWRMLEGAASSVSNVSQAVGYEDHSSFTRAFRAYFGASPRDVLNGASRSP